MSNPDQPQPPKTTEPAVNLEQLACAIDAGRRAIYKAALQAASELPERARPYVVAYMVRSASHDADFISGASFGNSRGPSAGPSIAGLIDVALRS